MPGGIVHPKSRHAARRLRWMAHAKSLSLKSLNPEEHAKSREKSRSLATRDSLSHEGTNEGTYSQNGTHPHRWRSQLLLIVTGLLLPLALSHT